MKISKKLIVSIILIALAYFLLAIYFQNSSLINSTIFASAGVGYKIALTAALMQGFSHTMNALQFSLFILTGLLIGVNITLIGQRVVQMKKAGKVHVIAGGSSMLGIFSGGCASCGLPLLSFLGLSSLVLYLPFKGAELPYISIILLLFSLFFLIKNNKAQVCEVKNSTNHG